MSFLEMKYVVVKCDAKGESLFIFPATYTHKFFAENISNMQVEKGNAWERYYQEPVSAGFTDGKKCYGRSESLDLKSRPQDTALLEEGGHQHK